MLPKMRRAVDLDPTFYPSTDNMGEAELHRLIAELLRIQLERFLGRGWRVGADQFFYLQKGDATDRCCPDVYAFRGLQGPLVRSWKTWELPRPPEFCFEIVSSYSLKDYIEAPVAQGRMGTKELIVYDPEGRGRRDRNTWRIHRRRKGGFYLVSASDEDRIRSEALGCWLRLVGRGDSRRIRPATGRHGDKLFLTADEELLVARKAAKDEREAAKDEREAAKDEIERLRALLERKTR